MSNLRSALKLGGYDSEEVFFYNRNRKLIEKMRESKGANDPSLDNVIPFPKTFKTPQNIKLKKTA